MPSIAPHPLPLSDVLSARRGGVATLCPACHLLTDADRIVPADPTAQHGLRCRHCGRGSTAGFRYQPIVGDLVAFNDPGRYRTFEVLAATAHSLRLRACSAGAAVRLGELTLHEARRDRRGRVLVLWLRPDQSYRASRWGSPLTCAPTVRGVPVTRSAPAR